MTLLGHGFLLVGRLRFKNTRGREREPIGHFAIPCALFCFVIILLFCHYLLFCYCFSCLAIFFCLFALRTLLTGTNSRADGQTDGRSDGRTDGRTDGRSDGRTDGRTVGRTVGRTDGRTRPENIFSEKK